MFRFFGVFLFVFLSFNKASAAITKVDAKYVPQMHCYFRGEGDGRWQACSYIYPNSGGKVLYYFNGLFGSRLTWRDSQFEKDLIKHWIDSGEKPPIVITISFSPPLLHKLIWFMVEKNNSRLSGKYEVVTQTILPSVQEKLIKPTKVTIEENYLMGVSMGAFNATQLYFKFEGFFSKAALICTPASIVTPFDGEYMIERFIARNQADKKLVNFANGVAKDYMYNSAEWDKHSPISLAFRHLSPASIPVYVANGTGDDFGFDEGDILFARIAKANGAPVTARFYKNREHCQVEPKPIVDFFTGVGTSPVAKDEIDIFEIPKDAMKWFAL